MLALYVPFSKHKHKQSLHEGINMTYKLTYTTIILLHAFPHTYAHKYIHTNQILVLCYVLGFYIFLYYICMEVLDNMEGTQYDVFCFILFLQILVSLLTLNATVVIKILTSNKSGDASNTPFH